MSISIAIIAHNEEKNLPRALESAVWADEIILVDCGSTDGTAAAAENFKVRFFSRPNSTAVYINKQFAIDQAASDWIFILDADEEIPPELREEIKEVTSSPYGAAAFKIPRRNFYFGRWLKHGGKYPDTQLRLFRRGKARFLPLPVHERLEVDGETSRLSRPLNHYPCAVMEDVLRKRAFYGEALAKSYALKGKSRLLILLRPFNCFFVNYLLKMGFLDGTQGLKTALMDFRTVMASAVLYIKKGRNL
ncbi:MAG TPA: hypothetical protein DER10_06770 [Elusimicrobia bacterium]|nr:hypothetical protein [Elusimicrobiota bacterium]